MKIALTGGMGCGKSTATRFFAEAGCRTLDSDRIVRDELLPSAAVIAAVGERFPDTIAADKTIDRARLAQRIFANDSDRLWLEAMLHPLVIAAWERAVAGEPAALWVIEVPLLFEKGLEKWFDFTVCVSTTPARQLARLAERGFTQALAEQRISHQLPLAKKIELSDFVLSNDGSTSHLRAQIARLVEHLKNRS